MDKQAVWGFLIFLMLSLPVRGQEVSANYVEHFFGVCHMGEEEVQFADDLGVKWSRKGISWSNNEPRKGEYDFGKSDKLVQSVYRKGGNLLGVLSNIPLWASTAPENPVVNPKHFPFKKDYKSRWKKYVEKVVERYPEVEYFEIWNEPNIDWFLNTDNNHEFYVEYILKPAAEVIHEHGKKVVAPSFTLEWPMDSWPASQRPSPYQRDLPSAIKDIDRWLSEQNAWESIDLLSVHYSKGDVDPVQMPKADNMMPFYEHIYQNWIKTGKIEGIWNTEEGLTAVEAGLAGFVSMEPWERTPYGQWVPRYTLPVLHWAIQHDWKSPHQYKVFWYHIVNRENPRSGTLGPTNLLGKENGEIVLSEPGRALQTLTQQFKGYENIGTFSGKVETGFGISATDKGAPNYFAPYHFTNYAFQMDGELFVAVWLDLPGIEEADPQQPGIDVIVKGLARGKNTLIQQIDYMTGEIEKVEDYSWSPNKQQLKINVPRTEAPILYLKIK